MCKNTSTFSKLNPLTFEYLGAVEMPQMNNGNFANFPAIDAQQEAIYWQFIEQRQEEMRRQIEKGANQILAGFAVVFALTLGWIFC